MCEKFCFQHFKGPPCVVNWCLPFQFQVFSSLFFLPESTIIIDNHASFLKRLAYFPAKIKMRYKRITDFKSYTPYPDMFFPPHFSGIPLFQIQIFPLRFFFYSIFTSNFANFPLCRPCKIICAYPGSTSLTLHMVRVNFKKTNLGYGMETSCLIKYLSK